MAKSATTAPLAFRGTPGALSAAVAEPDDVPRRMPVRLMLGGKAKAPFVGRALRLEGDMMVQMTVPPRTPPGRYRGTVEIEGAEREVVIDVEPEIELQAVPDQLTLEAKPGEHVAVDLTLANAGNVAVEIRRAYALGIFAAGGLERALHSAYTDERPKGERRVDYLAERLAEEHGGIVRVAVQKGAGSLDSGETRDVRFNFHVPPGLTAGRTYSGTLPLHDLRYYVRLVVVEGKAKPAR